MSFHNMAPTCRRFQRAPLLREAMPSVSTRTENVRMNDSAVNIAVNAPANTATNHRLTSLPAIDAVAFLKPSTMANRQVAAAMTQRGGGDHVGQQGVVKFEHQAGRDRLGRLPASSRAMLSISGESRRARRRCNSWRVGSSLACAICWSMLLQQLLQFTGRLVHRRTV